MHRNEGFLRIISVDFRCAVHLGGSSGMSKTTLEKGVLVDRNVAFVFEHDDTVELDISY